MSRLILEAIIDSNPTYLTFSQVKEYLIEIENKLSDDFYITIESNEYRIISDNAIWDIYVEEIQRTVEDCYDLKIPDFVAVDWEETANNCLVDGYGHTFASYDGEEIETKSKDGDYYHIFRTN